ncbi:MAG: lipopolysaccharide transport periplasmic protein LptA [Thermodesulfobacteriota bacterium]
MGLNLAKGTFVLWLVAAVSTGCTLFDRPMQPPKGRTADQLLKEGSAQLEQRNYRAAIEAFYKLKYDYPSDTAAMLADLKIADAHYANKEYPQAIESYSDFRKMHPASPYIPYVVYMLGLCHYQDILSVDRDQTNTEKALSEFQYLLTHFPNTPYAYDANEKAKDCMKRLSDHEVYVGNFYYRMKKYPAAIQRFEAAITKYPSVPLDEEVLFALAEAYRLTQQPEKNQRTLKALLQQYPKGKYAKKAQALIDEAPSELAPPPSPQPAASPPQSGRPQASVSGVTGVTPPVAITKAQEQRPTGVPALGKAEAETPLAKEPIAEDSGKTDGPKLGPTPLEVETHTTDEVDAPRERPSPLPTALNQEQEHVLSATQGAFPSEVPATSHAAEEEASIAATPTETPAPIPSASRGADKGERPSGSGEDTPSGAPSPSPPPGGEKPTPAKTIEERMGFGQLKGDKPINISADRMDAFQRENRVIFEGNVVVNQEETYIYAQRITADMASQETGGGIQKVVAVKNVRITQNDRVATCDRAEFDHISRTIELSGSPKIWQGKDWIDGERVLVNLDQDKMTVVGGEEKRVSAVLYPKTVKETAEPPAEAKKGSRPTFTAPFAPPTQGPVEAKREEKRVAKAAPSSGPERTTGSPPPVSDKQEATVPVEEGQEGPEVSRTLTVQEQPHTTAAAHAEEEDAARIARAALAERPKARPSAQPAETVGTAAQASTRSATSNLLAPVKAFVEQWRKAWESKDLDAYMACYSPRFQSEKRDWKAWRSYKAGLNDKYRSIRVEVEKLEIIPHEGGVKASFVQRYRADGYQDVGRKVLELVQEDGRWKILRETWRTL